MFLGFIYVILLLLVHGAVSISVNLHSFDECSIFFGDKYKIVDEASGDIFCNFDGVSIIAGSLVREKGGDTDVVTFSSTIGNAQADFVGRATSVVNTTGINVHLDKFTAENEDGTIIRCDIIPTDSASLKEIDILPALTSSSIPDVNVADFDTGTDKTNEINADTDVTVTGTTSTFTVGGDTYPAGVITTTQDGTAVSCSEANSCSVPVTCGSEEFTTTIEFTSTVFCQEKKTSVVLKCNEETTEPPTQTTPPACPEDTNKCDCTYAFGLFLGPGLLVPIGNMIAQAIILLIYTGKICASVTCVKNLTRQRRLFDMKIQAVIQILLCLLTIACTIANGVCYDQNKECDNCVEDKSPVYTVAVPSVMSVLYIVFLCVEFLVIVPKYVTGSEGDACGNAESGAGSGDKPTSNKVHDIPEGVPRTDPFTPRKLPPIGQGKNK